MNFWTTYNEQPFLQKPNRTLLGSGALLRRHGLVQCPKRGGKWSHFDLRHFEYRPELLRKWQLSRVTGRPTASRRSPWAHLTLNLAATPLFSSAGLP